MIEDSPRFTNGADSPYRDACDHNHQDPPSHVHFLRWLSCAGLSRLSRGFRFPVTPAVRRWSRGVAVAGADLRLASILTLLRLTDGLRSSRYASGFRRNGFAHQPAHSPLHRQGHWRAPKGLSGPLKMCLVQRPCRYRLRSRQASCHRSPLIPVCESNRSGAGSLDETLAEPMEDMLPIGKLFVNT